MADDRLKRLSAYTAAPEDVTIIGIDTQHAFGEHPLRDTDDRLFEDLDEGFVLNIMAFGVIDPVNVQREGDMLVVVDGRTRARAAREANRRLREKGLVELRLPLTFKDGDEKRLVGIMVSKNAQRREDSILDKAQKAQVMVDYGASQQELEYAFGVKWRSIRQWLSLLSADKVVRDAVKAKKIPASAGIKLAKLDRDGQKAALGELLTKPKDTQPTAGDAEEVVDRLKPEPKPKGPRPVSKSKLAKLADTPSLGRNVHPEAQAMLLWALGRGPSSDVPGLAQALEDAGLEALAEPATPEAAE